MLDRRDSPAPSFETERLTLRPHTLDDFAESAAMWADPEVTRHIIGRPSTQEEAWGRLHRYAGHWALLGFGYWVVREKASGRFVGEVGLADFRRAIEPSFDGAPEIGWALVPSAQGRGFGVEAVRAALAWSEARFGPIRIVCIIAPENTPSLRLANKCGFREIARTTYKGDPTIVFERG
ncbi:GNAT family N-acetyltransferase [Polyangium aurulentum]|uniref:GNAT family N-acetyltransferase n=1 Tax=Polyangium aurulentum TaxID=2567896 RepID=UPI0010AEEA4E|nr:GNAT family N-acetyltransferase [Polyangium aurulentum]UQA56696.1 GNAT family N-acetyltransferase [Polyangium aurulentum]